jgi:glycerol-3-phosphate acyltransferase PlsY
LKIVILSVFAFLLGSIPTGLLIVRSRGIDLRRIGSGNIGATNVLRSTGKWSALLTLCGDILKGALAVLIARHFGAGMLFEGIIGIFSILGHNFSVFLRFKGGKGVATSLGVLSAYSPQTALITGIIWLLTLMVSKYSSMGALVSFGSLPVIIVFLDTAEKLPVALIITFMIFLRHKENISRLLNGTEMKVGKRA